MVLEHHSVIIHQLNNIWTFFFFFFLHFGFITNKAAMNICLQVFV